MSREDTTRGAVKSASSHGGLTRKIVGRVVALIIAGVGLYAVWPALLQVFSSWPTLRELDPIWFLVMPLFEVLSLACLWALLRLALHRRGWFLSVTTQLASSAVSRVVPGGAATGGALQYRMLAKGGVDGPRIATSLAAVTVLTTTTLLALPVLSLPAILGGLPVDRSLLRAALIGIMVFVAAVAISTLFLATSKPLRTLGRFVQRLRNRVRRKKPPLEGLDDRLVSERDLMRQTLGRKWWVALLGSFGKALFDFLALLAALIAVGAEPKPSLVLLAYVISSLLGMIPLTPGGLGFVEAGLVATLALAGVGGGDASAATLAYRLVSFWLPIPAGLVAYIVYRRRYGRPDEEPEEAIVEEEI
ncbi:MAG: YbhN family protein [Thermoleophilia bacterium]|jgi:hypothetical protein|nr:YbhN family protein [Thermoleophilia bacterium]